MSNNLFAAAGRPPAGTFGNSAAVRQEFANIEEAFEKLKRHHLTFYFADLNTAGNLYQRIGETGLITKVTVTPAANNATAATVITVAINGSAVTMPALQVGAAGVAGTSVSVTPTSGNEADDDDDVIRVTTDGGGSGVMPGYVQIVVERS